MGNLLSKDEFRTLIKLAKKVLWSDAETRRKIQDQKVNIVPANFYSDIPLVEDIDQSFEYRNAGEEVYNSGIFNRGKLEDFLKILFEYSAEFNPSVEKNNRYPDAFYWRNPAFSYSDAMAYYCVIRHFKPNHILEIGSGFSTLVANEALRKNGTGSLTLIEPYPMKFLRTLDCVDSVIESFVQDIPVSDLVDMIDNSDVWFIDSTHTVKIGSDCLYLYLLVMPRVSEDIIIHSHDIYLPFGFPPNQALEKHIYWTEQYLLYAYMLDNPRLDVLFSSAYSHEKLKEPLDCFMRGKYPAGGASIWYKLSAKKDHN